jgi:5-methylcytosine-specific restriction endonuclease McrA
MEKYKDLTGMQFGSLTAVSISGRTKDKSIIWLCKCECGNTSNVTASNLIRGGTKSCGCSRKKVYVDLLGMEIGYLKIVKLLGNAPSGRSCIWLCECLCGNMIEVRSDNLLSGKKFDCGCIAKDLRYEKLSLNKTKLWDTKYSDFIRRIRTTTSYLKWKNAVMERDQYKCQDCFCDNPPRLDVHHIIPLKEIIQNHVIETYAQALDCEMIWDTDNGITLCKKCHAAYRGTKANRIRFKDKIAILEQAPQLRAFYP